jgi:hypothetical protein
VKIAAYRITMETAEDEPGRTAFSVLKNAVPSHSIQRNILVSVVLVDLESSEVSRR